MPSATALAAAWREWYAAAVALRKLQFIQETVQKRREYSVEDDDEENEDNDAYKRVHPQAPVEVSLDHDTIDGPSILYLSSCTTIVRHSTWTWLLSPKSPCDRNKSVSTVANLPRPPLPVVPAACVANDASRV